MGGRCLCRTRQLHFFTCSFSALLDLSSATFTCALLFGVILKSEVRVSQRWSSFIRVKRNFSQGYLPFAVVADPEKLLFEQFRVGSSMWALLHPCAWEKLLQASVSKDKPAGNPAPNGGIWGLPAEFLIAETGIVKAAHYGKHVDDRWSVDELLSLARSCRKIRYT
jgi:hypothetical protein